MSKSAYSAEIRSSFGTKFQLNIMRKSRTFLDRNSLEKIYISCIRPLMEYADVIWDNQKQNLINKLENI